VKGIEVLLLLIIVSAIPSLALFFWLRNREWYGKLSSLRFLAAIGAGLVSLLLAALMQHFLPGPSRAVTAGQVLTGLFVRVALLEELARFITLLVLLRIIWRRDMDKETGILAGLAAGIGFAVVESATYGATDLGIALLRAFTAAPLHGACGARVGASAAIIKDEPAHGIVLLVTAVLIHAVYDFFIINPALPWVLSVLVALVALGATLLNLGVQDK
jgi:RsiW-degrading membrane proteinase PrsW (M82 family)